MGLQSVSFPISSSWFQYSLEENPDYGTSTMTYDEYLDFFSRLEKEHTKFSGVENPDLSSFKAAGLKLITWHGLPDPAIMPQVTINYRKQAESTMGGSSAVNEFFRLFMAPGGVNCAPGAGSTPKMQTAIEALMVLKTAMLQIHCERRPMKLLAMSLHEISVLIHLLPVMIYDGTGDFHSPKIFHCAKTFSSKA